MLLFSSCARFLRSAQRSSSWHKPLSKSCVSGEPDEPFIINPSHVQAFCIKKNICYWCIAALSVFTGRPAADKSTEGGYLAPVWTRSCTVAQTNRVQFNYQLAESLSAIAGCYQGKYIFSLKNDITFEKLIKTFFIHHHPIDSRNWHISAHRLSLISRVGHCS